MNLSEYLSTASSKPNLTKPESNLIAKIEAMGWRINPMPTATINRFTGLTRTLDPFVSALTEFVLISYDNYMRTQGQFSFNGVKFPVSTFDRVKYLVLKLDSQAYYDFID